MSLNHQERRKIERQIMPVRKDEPTQASPIASARGEDMRFTRKEGVLTAFATGLTLASLKPDDWKVVVPMLALSWGAVAYLCFMHPGRKLSRFGVGVAVTIVLCLIGGRALRPEAPASRVNIHGNVGIDPLGRTLADNTGTINGMQLGHDKVLTRLPDGKETKSAEIKDRDTSQSINPPIYKERTQSPTLTLKGGTPARDGRSRPVSTKEIQGKVYDLGHDAHVFGAMLSNYLRQASRSIVYKQDRPSESEMAVLSGQEIDQWRERFFPIAIDIKHRLSQFGIYDQVIDQYVGPKDAVTDIAQTGYVLDSGSPYR